MLPALDSRLLGNLLLVALAAAPAAAQAGLLDPGFGGGDGVLTEQLSSSPFDVAYAVVVQPDGKIVTAGRSRSSTTGLSSFAITRHHADGTLDTGFGSGGQVAAFAGHNVFCFDVRLDASGRIVAAGRAYVSGQWDVGVLRLTSTGALDGTFGTGGLVRFALAQNATDYANAVAVQPDGKVVVACYVSRPSGQNIAVARLSANGSLDKTFGTKGIAILGSLGDGGYVALRAIALQPDGRILVGGGSSTASRWSVIRLNANGSLDGSFGSGGVANTSFGASCSLSGMALQPDGKIVAVGVFRTTPTPSPSYFAAARCLPGGALDTTFGTAGVVLSGVECVSRQCVVQPDGRIVAGLTLSSSGDDTHMTLFRMLGNGVADAGFGTNGFATPTDPAGAAVRENLQAIAIDPTTGNIVGAGLSEDPPFPSAVVRFALARWLGN
ncbi:MAG TPA: delta-60 repeat domain-containing protein [Planctomycetota bacterium]